MRKLSFLAAFVATAVLGAIFIVPSTAAPQGATVERTNKLQDLFVRGTTNDGQTFRGRLDVNKFFVNDAGELRAAGDLTGKVRNSAGEVTRTLENERVRTAVQFPPGASCDILHLEIGPIDLDLLGLVIHIDPIVIDITAEPGPGNLLGNLLCAIAHLLDDPPGTLNQILANLLNLLARLLRLLG